MRGGRGGLGSPQGRSGPGLGLRLIQGLSSPSGRPNMRITLTQKQITQLLPYYDRVKASAVAGSPGMLVAQICRNQDGKWWMEPGFLEHEHALCITGKGQPCPTPLPTKPAGNTVPRSVQSAPGEPADRPGTVPSVNHQQDSCA